MGVDDAPIDLIATPDEAQLYVTGLNSVTVIDTLAMAAESVLAGDLPRRIHLSAGLCVRGWVSPR